MEVTKASWGEREGLQREEPVGPRHMGQRTLKQFEPIKREGPLSDL